MLEKFWHGLSKSSWLPGHAHLTFQAWRNFSISPPRTCSQIRPWRPARSSEMLHVFTHPQVAFCMHFSTNSVLRSMPLFEEHASRSLLPTTVHVNFKTACLQASFTTHRTCQNFSNMSSVTFLISPSMLFSAFTHVEMS